MVWLIGIVCLAIGVVIGVAFASRFNSSPSRIKELESQLKSMEQAHDRYKDDVSDHFNTTADLVQQMTESYRDVYQHLASGAQNLCTGDVANKLLPAGSDAVFENSSDEFSGVAPPKDYAAKQKPDQIGALAEDFGIDKPKSGSNENNPT